MELACDLEVDVNGHQRFFVDKEIVSSFFGKLCQLLQKTSISGGEVCNRPLKITFHDFPGGSKAFELLTRFCYNGGEVHISASNVCLLHCAAIFMEMKEEIHSSNLIKRTTRCLRGMTHWTWSENLLALRQCQEFVPAATDSGILDKLIDSLLLKIATNVDSSASNSSPESSVVFSCDTKSGEILKNSRRAWWFEDLSTLNLPIVEKMVIVMINQKFDNQILCRFLFYYLKAFFICARPVEKSQAAETVTNLLNLLDKNSLSGRGLFGILRTTHGLSMEKSCRDKLVSMVGWHLDQATLDDLLFPAPTGTGHLYDVNLVLRFSKSFLIGDNRTSPTAMKKVANLIDKYTVEVAPDSSLKPSKFIALVKALPDSARESYDEVYRAMDMYFEIHAALSDEEKMNICSALNHDKLSLEICKHIAQNSRIPSRAAMQAVVSQQSKLKNLLEASDRLGADHPTPPFKIEGRKTVKEEGGDRISLFAKRVDLSTENGKLRFSLKGMQWKVMELEKMCKKMETEMSKINKNKVGGHGNARLPRLCS